MFPDSSEMGSLISFTDPGKSEEFLSSCDASLSTFSDLAFRFRETRSQTARTDTTKNRSPLTAIPTIAPVGKVVE